MNPMPIREKLKEPVKEEELPDHLKPRKFGELDDEIKVEQP